MPNFTDQSTEHTQSMWPGMQGHLWLSSAMPGLYEQTMPTPQGPESVEFRRMLEEALRHLTILETMRPYLGEAYDTYSALLRGSEESVEASLDYQPMPPARTVPMNTRFVIRGRGQPKPYPLEDE